MPVIDCLLPTPLWPRLSVGVSARRVLAIPLCPIFTRISAVPVQLSIGTLPFFCIAFIVIVQHHIIRRQFSGRISVLLNQRVSRLKEALSMINDNLFWTRRHFLSGFAGAVGAIGTIGGADL